MLILTILINLTVFSQVGITTKEEIKCFPISITKKIAQDLLKGDSAISELKLTNIQLLETEKKIFMKDSIIYNHEQKQKNYIKIIDLEKEKFSTLQDYTNKVELKLEKIEKKYKITTYTSVFLFGIIIFNFFIK